MIWDKYVKFLGKYGYDNCKLVSDRNYDSLVRVPDIRVTDRSFYFHEKSHVIVFIFFCDKRDKNNIFHGESAAAELTHLLTCLKIRSNVVLF